MSPRTLDRRRATVLFADIVGFTPLCERAGVEHAYAIVTGCLKLLDGVARRHGGVVDKYLGDALMAVFGIPAPLDNSSAAALAAALEMQRTVEAYNRQVQSPVALALKAGVNSGMMTAGDLRGAVVREFHVMGDAVNVAARLKERAPAGCVFVGGDAADDARALFAFTPMAPLALKGKSTSVAAYEAHAAPDDTESAWPRATVFTPRVGRTDELGALRAALRELEGGVGGVVTLVGEVGSGKTRLLHELGDELAAERAEGGSLALRAARTLAAAHATLASTAGPLALALDEPQPPLEDDALT